MPLHTAVLHANCGLGLVQNRGLGTHWPQNAFFLGPLLVTFWHKLTPKPPCVNGKQDGMSKLKNLNSIMSNYLIYSIRIVRFHKGPVQRQFRSSCMSKFVTFQFFNTVAWFWKCKIASYLATTGLLDRIWNFAQKLRFFAKFCKFIVLGQKPVWRFQILKILTKVRNNCGSSLGFFTFFFVRPPELFRKLNNFHFAREGHFEKSVHGVGKKFHSIGVISFSKENHPILS